MVNVPRRFIAAPHSIQQQAPFRPQSSAPFEVGQPFFAARSKSNLDNASDGSGGSASRFRGGPRFPRAGSGRPSF
ncbi:hypothetical protein IAR50_001229 [Cryptococcus sp. DSM 104548]